MKVSEIAKLVDGVVVCGHDRLHHEVEYACASDLMSDVLTLHTTNSLLVTGLCNLQTVRTAEFSDINCIVVARNKKVSQEMIDLANENDLVIIECKYSVFKTSGILFSAGIKPEY